jgi:Mitochondrial fission ELM1
LGAGKGEKHLMTRDVQADEINRRPLAGLRGWLITTGMAGMDVQTRGVAEALGLDYEIKRVEPRGIWRLGAPWAPVAPSERFGQPGSQFAPPWPDIAISLGRGGGPYMRALRRRAGPATFTVVLQDPKTGLGTADMIWAPEHGRLRGANLFTTLIVAELVDRVLAAKDDGDARERECGDGGRHRAPQLGLALCGEAVRGRRAASELIAVVGEARRELPHHALPAHAR